MEIPIAGRSTRAVSLRTERSLSRGFPSLDLDTVLEERSDPEQTQVFFMQKLIAITSINRASISFAFQTDLMTPESPSDPLHRPGDLFSS